MQLGARLVHTESKLQSLWAADGEATTKQTWAHALVPQNQSHAQMRNAPIL